MSDGQKNSPIRIAIEKAKELYDQEDVTILDVVDTDSFAEFSYKIKGAIRIDPEISRFVTADTIIDGDLDTQGWNRFSYVKGRSNDITEKTMIETLGLSCHTTQTLMKTDADKIALAKFTLDKILLS